VEQDEQRNVNASRKPPCACISAFVRVCAHVCEFDCVFSCLLDKWTNEGRMAAGGGLPGPE